MEMMSRMALPPPSLIKESECSDDDEECENWETPKQNYTDVLVNARNAGADDDESTGLLRSVLGNTTNGFNFAFSSNLTKV